MIFSTFWRYTNKYCSVWRSRTLQREGKVGSREISGWSKTTEPWQLQRLRKWHSVSSWKSVVNSNQRSPVQAEGKEPDRRWRGQSVGADAVKRGCTQRQVRGGMEISRRAADVEEMRGKWGSYSYKTYKPRRYTFVGNKSKNLSGKASRLGKFKIR
jgi:hypothetical protein